MRELFDLVNQHNREQDAALEKFERWTTTRMQGQDDVVDLVACELRKEAARKADGQLEMQVLRTDFDYMKKNILNRITDSYIQFNELKKSVGTELEAIREFQATTASVAQLAPTSAH